jgi:hypothetical protein
MSTVTLFKAFVQGMTDYIAKHNANYSTIESTLNYILGMLTGATGGDLSVPSGLKEIFDRKGLIGVGSYDFSEGVLSGPEYNLGVNAGAYWSGSTFLSKASATNLSLAGRATGDYYVNLDASGVPSVSDAAGGDCIRQFHWDAGTHTVSGKAIHSGVAILFDGDDYADQLTSAARAKTFTKVADRLEEIELLLGEIAGFYAQGTHNGLDFYYQGGKVRNDSSVYSTPDGHVTLADNATNYVELDPATGQVSRTTSGFTSGRIPLYRVTTASGAITGVMDLRTWALAGTGGGGGGGHTQNTDVGTTAEEFEVDRDAAGTPTGRAGFKVNNGDNPAGLLKYNRDTRQWEYSNDGGDSWYVLGEANLELGAQEFTRYVTKEDPPLVYSENSRGPSADYEVIDLTGYFTPEPQFGVRAATLRVFFKDSAPGFGVKVLFKKGGSASSPAVAFTVWSDEGDAEQKPADIIVPVGDDYTVEFYVFASGPDTASLSVYLLGYFEEVYGVGTQEKTLVTSGRTVGANNSAIWSITGFVNRGLAHYLKVEETGGALVGTYDIELYSRDTFLADGLIYKATSINPITEYQDWMPFWVQDYDNTRELHLKIVNHDASNQGVFAVTLKVEQFA